MLAFCIIAMIVFPCCNNRNVTETELNNELEEKDSIPVPTEITLVYQDSCAIYKVEKTADSLFITMSKSGSKRFEILFEREIMDLEETNIRQLVSDIPPSVIPYYYGDLVKGDAEISITLNNDTILVNKDLSKSVVPAQLEQIYKYMVCLSLDLDSHIYRMEQKAKK